MSKLDNIVDAYGSTTPIEILVEFGPASTPVVEHSSQLFSAEFGRDGADLVLSNFGLPDIRIANYFNSNSPADIRTQDGKILAGDVVEKLAGPEFPAQYAQAGAAGDSGAIGQVESISGQVTVLRASGVRETLSLGAKVFANDVVQTGGGGALALTFVDGTIFTLGESSRMVLDSLIYDPASSQNSGLFNLVEGSFVFIAGEVAKTGGMDVKTPAATMGIRGTTVIVKIESINGETQVEVSLNQDPDGGQGQFTLTGLDGAEIANVNSIATKWLISPVEGQTREIVRTPEELAVDRGFLGQAIGAYRAANERVNDGGEFVETEGGGPDSTQDPDAPPEDSPDEPTDETPDNETEQDDRRGQLGSGIKTELAVDTSQPELLTETVVISQLRTGGEVVPVGIFQTEEEFSLISDEPLLEPDPVEPLETKSEEPEEIEEDEPHVQPINLPPDIAPPTVTTRVEEDGSVVLDGFNFSDPEDDILTATITAGSTLTLASGSGVTILQGTGVNEEVTVIRGTGEQISNALNGAVYMPTPNADVSGSLTIELSDGNLSTTSTLTIDISPTQDAPVALPDFLEVSQNDNGLTGNLLANDYDVDTNPTPDDLTVVSVTVDGVDYGLTGGVASILLASGAQITIRQDGSYVFDTNNAFGALNGGEVVTETISYTLSDGHEADHGVTTTGHLNIAITGTDDAPVISGDAQIIVAPGYSIALSQADLLTQDLDTTATNLVYTVTSAPLLGQLELSGEPGLPITSFTQQNIDDGELIYVHTDSVDGEDNFSFTVTDGRVTLGGDVDVAITQPNQDPTGSGLPASLTIDEDSTALIELRNLALSDPDAGNAPATLTFVAENASLHALSSAEVTVTITATGLTMVGSMADLVAAFGDPEFLTITPDQDISGIGAASVTVSISDNGNSGIGGGGDIEIGTIDVNINPFNDAPVLTVADQETGYVENDAETIITTSISINDPDDTHIESAEVRISEAFQAGDILKFVDTSTITGTYDSATGILTLTGSDTLENYATALESVTYSHSTDDISDAVRTISYAVDDGESESYLAYANVLPTAVNDAPVLTDFPAEFHVDEDITQDINFYDLVPFGETFSDPDAGDNVVEFTFTLSSGVLTFPPGGSNITIDGLTITGTVSAINDYLNNGGTDDTFVRFTTDPDSTENVSLNITVNDLGNSGTGGPLSDSVDLDIIVFPVDDPATVTLSLDTNTYSENIGAVLVDGNVSIVDVDSANLISATVEISTNYQAESDILAFTDTANISGSFDIGTGVLTLTGTDTIAAYEAALSSVTFENISDNPTTDARAIVFNVNDGLGNGFSDTINMTVTSSNDAPELTATAQTLSYTEDDPATTIATTIAIDDPDNGDLVSQATISISRNFEVGDVLGFSDTTNITGSYDATTGILTLAGNDTAANYETALESITYSTTSQNPSELQRDISYQVGDTGGALSDVEIGANVEPLAVNDAPSIAAFGEFEVTEDQPGELTFSGTPISDLDAGNGEVSVTLSADRGLLDFPSTTQITISGNLLKGSVAAINQYLVSGGDDGDKITYTSEPNGINPVTLTLTVDDLGNTGGLPLTATASTVINIDPVNDAPNLTAETGNMRYTEDDPATTIATTIAIYDPDIGDLISQATVTISEHFEVGDVLEFSNTVNITGSYDAATGIITLTGNDTAENYKTALESIRFSSTSQNPSEMLRALTYQVEDVGGALSNVVVGANVELRASNDAPSIGTLDELEVMEDAPGAVSFTTAVLSDPDAGNAEVSLLVLVNSGTLTFPSATGITISGSTLTGTIADLNQYLMHGGAEGAPITFTSELNSTAPVTLTLRIDDQGNSGGPAFTDFASTTITINPVNDAPVLTDFPAEFHVDEDVTQDINFYDIEPFGETFSDLDAGDNVVEFTFTLSSGVLTFPPGGSNITIDGLTITGTVSAINDYLNNGGTDDTFIRFTTDQDSTENVNLNITVNDLGNTGSGGSLSDSVDLEIIVHPVDDPGVVNMSADSNSYSENHAAVIIDDEVSVIDVDSTSFIRAGVAITENFQVGSDVLSFVDTANITGSYDAATGVLILSGTDTVAAYETALRSVTYHNTSDNPDTADRTILFNVDDGPGFGFSDTITMSVNASNDAPAINSTLIAASAEQVLNGGFQEGTYDPANVNILASGSTNITNWIVTNDNVEYLEEISAGDDGERNRTVSLNGDEPGAIDTMIFTTVGQQYEVSFQGLGDGTLNVIATGGTTGNYVFESDSNGQYHSYVFTADSLETFLTFTSTTTGAVGPTLDDVTVREIVGDTIDVVEDTPIEISDIQITDVDTDAGSTFTATLSSGFGLLTVNDSVQSGLGSAQISDNGTYLVTLTGTLFQINNTLAAVDGVTYTPNLDFSGADAIEVHVSDGDATDPQTGTETISLNVQGRSDAAPASSNVGDVVEGSVENLSGIQFVGFDDATVSHGVSNVGDINDDGIDDFAIGATDSSIEGVGAPNLTGSVYVIYGIEGENPYAAYANADGEVSLDDMAVDGTAFELIGAASGDRTGFSVSGGGDINNDGISDLVVGAHFVDSPLNSGAAYIVYGGQDFESLTNAENGEILLGNLGVTGTNNLEGFEFNHVDSNAELGYDVSLTGDLNNDGISDLIVSHLSNPSENDSGAWTIFGGQDFASATDSATGAFDIDEIGNSIDGFLLAGEATTDDAGVSIDVVSDFNGDGIDDLLVGASSEDSAGFQSGASYLVYGGQDWDALKLNSGSPTISLSQLGTGSTDLQGFKIENGVEGGSLGLSVSSAGDVNGDGIGDLLATAPGNSSSLTTSSTYLLYGGQNLSGTITTSQIGSGGTGAVNGAVFIERPEGEYVSQATALGDIDGDGYSDILIGSQSVGDGVGGSVGYSYIVYGSSAPASGTHSLADVGSAIDGFAITGEDSSTIYGQRAQSVGDVNSDGYNDFIVADIGNSDGGPGAGAAYLIYGSDFNNRLDMVAGADELVGGAGRNIIHGTPGDDVINGGGGGDIITTGAGDDEITIGNSFIDFIDAGAGTDTLKFGDSGSFDLTNINDLRLQSIEALDTTNGLVNNVTLGITDIFQITDDANAALESILEQDLPTSFVIDADANDTYTFENGSAGGIWTLNTGLSASAPNYDVYEYVESGSSDVLATLAIDDDVTPTIV